MLKHPIAWLLVLLTTAGLAFLIVHSLPDVKRYLRIRRMLLRAAPPATSGRHRRTAR